MLRPDPPSYVASMKEPGFRSRASIKEEQERREKHGTPMGRLSGKPIIVFVLVFAVLVWLVLVVSGQLQSD